MILPSGLAHGSEKVLQFWTLETVGGEALFV
jgi:hypothetical protein